jgi:hypothetical protein
MADCTITVGFQEVTILNADMSDTVRDNLQPKTMYTDNRVKFHVLMSQPRPTQSKIMGYHFEYSKEGITGQFSLNNGFFVSYDQKLFGVNSTFELLWEGSDLRIIALMDKDKYKENGKNDILSYFLVGRWRLNEKEKSKKVG